MPLCPTVHRPFGAAAQKGFAVVVIVVVVDVVVVVIDVVVDLQVFADVLTFQLKKQGYLQINGIYLNDEMTTIGKT